MTSTPQSSRCFPHVNTDFAEGLRFPYRMSVIAFPDSWPGRPAQRRAVMLGWVLNFSTMTAPTVWRTTMVLGWMDATWAMSASPLPQSVRLFLSPALPSTVIYASPEFAFAKTIAASVP